MLNVAASRAWNSLPANVRDAQSLLTFRRRLKILLFQSSYGWAWRLWAIIIPHLCNVLHVNCVKCPCNTFVWSVTLISAFLIIIIIIIIANLLYMYPAMSTLACPIFYFLPPESNLSPDWLVMTSGGIVYAQWIFSTCLPQCPVGLQCRHLKEVLHLSCGPSMTLPLCQAVIFCWTYWASCLSEDWVKKN